MGSYFMSLQLIWNLLHPFSLLRQLFDAVGLLKELIANRLAIFRRLKWATQTRINPIRSEFAEFPELNNVTDM